MHSVPRAQMALGEGRVFTLDEAQQRVSNTTAAVPVGERSVCIMLDRPSSGV
jgi:hypothetical protein